MKFKHISVNSFAQERHLAGSGQVYSEFTGPKSVLIEKVKTAIMFGGAVTRGYRDGVVTIRVAHAEFLSPVVQVGPGDEATMCYKARRPVEPPRWDAIPVLSGVRPKTPAVRADIVLYSSVVLAEDGSNELPAEEGNWEIISVNAESTDEQSPPPPATLMYNHFTSGVGGTATHMNAEEFEDALKQSFLFWKDRAFTRGR